MLLSALFTFTIGPILQLSALSDFSHVCMGKNNEQKLICFLFLSICEINMRECHTDLLCDQPIFVTQSSQPEAFFEQGAVHGSANSSELKIIALVDDQYSGHKISSLNILLYYSNHGK